MRDNAAMAGDEGQSRVFRRAGISYLRIPAKDAQASADFYHQVFGWTVDAARPDPSFEDGSGHVIGHLVPDLAVSGEAGVRPYVYVDSVQDTLRRVGERGGAPVEPPYAEGAVGSDLSRSSRQCHRRLATRVLRLKAYPNRFAQRPIAPAARAGWRLSRPQALLVAAAVVEGADAKVRV